MAKPSSPRTKGTPATIALTTLGISFTSHTYAHDPQATSFGEEAADALGFPYSHVFKTLMTVVDTTPYVAIVPVDRHLNLKAMAAAVHGKRADMAPSDIAQRLTGYVLGGISPIGQRTTVPTVLDESALDLATIYVSGGARGFDIGLAPSDLINITAATVAAIATGTTSPPQQAR